MFIVYDLSATGCSCKPTKLRTIRSELARMTSTYWKAMLWSAMLNAIKRARLLSFTGHSFIRACNPIKRSQNTDIFGCHFFAGSHSRLCRRWSSWPLHSYRVGKSLSRAQNKNNQRSASTAILARHHSSTPLSAQLVHPVAACTFSHHNGAVVGLSFRGSMESARGLCHCWRHRSAHRIAKSLSDCNPPISRLQLFIAAPQIQSVFLSSSVGVKTRIDTHVHSRSQKHMRPAHTFCVVKVLCRFGT